MIVREFIDIHKEELRQYCNNPTSFFNLNIYNCDEPYSAIIIPMKYLYNKKIKEVRKSSMIIDDEEIISYSLYLEE